MLMGMPLVPPKMVTGKGQGGHVATGKGNGGTQQAYPGFKGSAGEK